MQLYGGRCGNLSILHRLSRNALPALLLAALLLLVSCENKSQAPANPLVQRGRAVYQANCTACHNPNPKLAGSVGPDVAGSSKELLEARVIHGNYPSGYRPKRETAVMRPLPHLKDDIEALHAYLNAGQ